jgi:hypothetical protein
MADIHGEAQPTRQRRLLQGALPHVVTAVVTLVLAWFVVPRDRVVVLQTPSKVTPLAGTVATPMPAMTATPAPPLVREMSRQEILDVKADTAALWCAVYLTRALAHASDAEAALARNDMTGTAQMLLLMDDALQRAAVTATSTVRDPIEQIHRDIVAVRQDLYVRPNGLDVRIKRLRQSLLTLIANPTLN